MDEKMKSIYLQASVKRGVWDAVTRNENFSKKKKKDFSTTILCL